LSGAQLHKPDAAVGLALYRSYRRDLHGKLLDLSGAERRVGLWRGDDLLGVGTRRRTRHSAAVQGRRTDPEDHGERLECVPVWCSDDRELHTSKWAGGDQRDD